MKYRNGFVSNSSSSSFIVRTDMDKDQFVAALNRYFLLVEEITGQSLLGECSKGDLEDRMVVYREDANHLYVGTTYDNSIPYSIIEFIRNLPGASYKWDE